MYSPVLEFKSSLTRLKSKCWQECFLLEALKEVCISLPFSVSRNHLYFMASGLLLSFFIFKANPSLLYFFHFLSLSLSHTHTISPQHLLLSPSLFCLPLAGSTQSTFSNSVSLTQSHLQSPFAMMSQSMDMQFCSL